MRRWNLDSRDYLGVADSATADALRASYGRLVPEEVQQATRQLLVIYENICPAYCAKAGVPYPEADVNHLRQLLDELDSLA
jgi:hypothetical protein